MDCHDFEDRFEAFLAGELPAPERAACEAHAAGCPACRELVELASAPDPAPSSGAAEGAEDLLGRVLAATSGPACDRAGELLASRLDEAEPADPLERELLDLHLAGCQSCRELARVLALLAEDLPRMAEVRPDPGFVNDVLAATLPLAVRWRRSLSRSFSRSWSRRWAGWLRRPRFAWEVAFVVTLLFLPVFASASSPMAGVPKTARSLAEENPVPHLWAGLERELAEAPRAVRRSEIARAVNRRLAWAEAAAFRFAGHARTLVGITGERWGTFWESAASFLDRDGGAGPSQETQNPSATRTGSAPRERHEDTP